jgi:hypothetical protein
LVWIYDELHGADLHLIVAVSDDAIADLNIQRFNFQLLPNLSGE